VTNGVAETQAEAQVLATTAQRFDSVSQSLESMLNSLMNELAVLESAWRGAAGTQFTTVKQKWHDSQRKIQMALTQTATAIRTSGSTYTSTDTDAASRVGTAGQGIDLPL
jgi:WXG100 family type VII secretion target